MSQVAHALAEATVRAGVQVELVRQARVATELNATLVTSALAAALDAVIHRLRDAGVPEDALQAARVAAHAAAGEVLEAAEDPDAQDDLRRSTLRELEGGRP